MLQEPGAPALARCEAREFLKARLDEAELSDALLAINELVTNASKFGSGQPLWLHLLVSSQRLVVTVTSGGSDGLAEMVACGRAANPVPSLDEGGRGLGIVIEIFDDLAVSCGRVTVVRAARQLGVSSHRRSALRVGDADFAFMRR
jgi:anti-sigma regulatory factor (Ser/Thr protein kinase)